MILKINDVIKNIAKYMHHQQDDIRQIVAEDALLGKYDNANLQELDKFMNGVLAKLSKFKKVDFDRQEKINNAKTEIQSNVNKKKISKTAKTGLAVMIEGNKIYESKAKDTFVKTIKYIGIQNVIGIIDIKANGNDFVSTQKPIVDERTNNPNYERIGDYYIITHFSNAKKREILEEIAHKLDKQIKVELIKKGITPSF